MYHLLWFSIEQDMYSSLCAVNKIVFGRKRFPVYVCIVSSLWQAPFPTRYWYTANPLAPLRCQSAGNSTGLKISSELHEDYWMINLHNHMRGMYNLKESFITAYVRCINVISLNHWMYNLELGPQADMFITDIQEERGLIFNEYS